MGTILKVLVAIPAILFTVFGLRWAVDPGGALPQQSLPRRRSLPGLALRWVRAAGARLEGPMRYATTFEEESLSEGVATPTLKTVS